MRMQQSDQVNGSLKFAGTGTGTDFDLNNREADIEAVDEDAPSDGIHDAENNTLEGDDGTRYYFKPDSILDSQESV